MAKILLVDFSAADRDLLRARDHDVGSLSTGWATGEDGPLEVPAGAEIVFYNVGGEPAAEGEDFHKGAHEELAGRIRDGLRVVCFVGGGGTRRVAGVVGPIPGLEIREAGRSEAVVFNPRALFHVPFERFKPSIAKAFRLFDEALAEGVWERETPDRGRIEVLAKTADGAVAAAVVPRGKGHVLLLPSFGAKNVEVVEFILKDRFALGGAAAGAPPAADWADKDEYAFPELKALVARRDEEKKRFEDALADYERQIREMKAGGQEEFLLLLRGEGAVLKRAVLHAFRYLGWGRIVDVDEYWKKVIRDKEEDLWLLDQADAPVEAAIRKGELLIVLVRGGKNWATDDECALLQKYKGRRMQEFGNTRMKAVLVGNYHSAVEPKERPSPFSAGQIEEAQKDGNGLLTTYELFRAVKAEKENRVSKEALREQIRLKTGLVTFDV